MPSEGQRNSALLHCAFQGGSLPPLTFVKSYLLVAVTTSLCLKILQAVPTSKDLKFKRIYNIVKDYIS